MAAFASPPVVPKLRGGIPSLLMGALRLARPANLVTAATDICAAAVVARTPVPVFLWLIAASISLYAGGVILNDFFDRHLDGVERPERPIPAGVIPPRAAAAAGYTLLLIGITLAFHVSRLSGLLGATLAGTILIYDGWAKRHTVGPIFMGMCRALNLLLGLSAFAAAARHLWPLALLPFSYVFAITALSRGEVRGGSRVVSGLTLLIVSCVLLALSCLTYLYGLPHQIALLTFVLFLAVRVEPALWRCWQQPEATTIRKGVHAGVVSLVVFDACLAAAFGGWIEGAAVLSLSVFSTELARFFAVT